MRSLIEGRSTYGCIWSMPQFIVVSEFWWLCMCYLSIYILCCVCDFGPWVTFFWFLCSLEYSLYSINFQPFELIIKNLFFYCTICSCTFLSLSVSLCNSQAVCETWYENKHHFDSENCLFAPSEKKEKKQQDFPYHVGALIYNFNAMHFKWTLKGQITVKNLIFLTLYWISYEQIQWCRYKIMVLSNRERFLVGILIVNLVGFWHESFCFFSTFPDSYKYMHLNTGLYVSYILFALSLFL